MNEEFNNIGEYNNVLDRKTRLSRFENTVLKVLMDNGGVLSAEDLTKQVATRLLAEKDVDEPEQEGTLYTEALRNLESRKAITYQHDRVVLSPSIMFATEY